MARRAWLRVALVVLGFACSGAPAFGQGAPADVEEVLVRGVRPEPGRQPIAEGEARQMPGSFGDPLRAIEALPGVTPIVSGLPYFLVRGAPSGNIGFFLDGVRVPALFHLGVGAAVIHPGLIHGVDLYRGGYPARFGRFTGGILSSEIRPLSDRPHAEASVRLFDASALVATPLPGGRSDVLASGRYGYPTPLLSLFAPNTGLGYWDYQTRARWRVSDGDELSVFVFGSDDSVSQRDQNTDPLAEVLRVQFHRVDLRWDRRTTATGRLRVALTLGYDRSATTSATQITAFGSGEVIAQQTSGLIENGTFGLRTEWTDRPARDADVRIGADVTLEPYHVIVPLFSVPSSDLAKLVSSWAANTPLVERGGDEFTQTDVNAGLYGELVWRPSSRVEIRPGLRVDAFTSRSPRRSAVGTLSGTEAAVGAVDPRLAARWEASRDLAWVVALGVTHQASNTPFPSPVLQFSQLSRGLQSAYQYSAGAEIKLPAEFTATADVFMHDYTGLAEYIEACPIDQPTCNFNGRAIGLELLVRRSLNKRLTGWVSYTLSRAERDSYWSGGTIRRLSEFDRTHVGNLVLAADLGRRWRAGGRMVAYSGLPYSMLTGSVGPPDARGPPFVRIDMRIEKRWNALGGSMAIAFEWLNVLLSKETFGTSCSSTFSGRGLPFCQPTEVGPITFPSIGLEAAW
jgi:hypothetical protein